MLHPPCCTFWHANASDRLPFESRRGKESNHLGLWHLLCGEALNRTVDLHLQPSPVTFTSSYAHQVRHAGVGAVLQVLGSHAVAKEVVQNALGVLRNLSDVGEGQAGILRSSGTSRLRPPPSPSPGLLLRTLSMHFTLTFTFTLTLTLNLTPQGSGCCFGR